MKWEVFTARYAMSHLKQISFIFVNASRFLNFSRQQQLHCTVRIQSLCGVFARRMYLVGYSNSLIPFLSQKEPLRRFDVADNNKTYSGSHVKYMIWIKCGVSQQTSNFMDFCPVDAALLNAHMTYKRTDMTSDRSFAQLRERVSKLCHCLLLKPQDKCPFKINYGAAICR